MMLVCKPNYGRRALQYPVRKPAGLNNKKRVLSDILDRLSQMQPVLWKWRSFLQRFKPFCVEPDRNHIKISLKT
jgi:hypothetical protein